MVSGQFHTYNSYTPIQKGAEDQYVKVYGEDDNDKEKNFGKYERFLIFFVQNIRT